MRLIAIDPGIESSAVLEFFVHGLPAPKGSVKAFMPKGWTRPILTSDTGPRLKDWANSISVCALEALKENSTEQMAMPVSVLLMFFMPRPKSAKKRKFVTVKPDIDKLCRAALDPLIGILFNDDSQVVALSASKHYADAENPPGMKVAISWLSPIDEHVASVTPAPQSSGVADLNAA